MSTVHDLILQKNTVVIGALAGLTAVSQVLSAEDFTLFCSLVPDGGELWDAFKSRRDAPGTARDYGFVDYAHEVLSEYSAVQKPTPSRFADSFASFAQLVSGMSPSIFPPDDAQDIKNGATYIPGEVTVARRAGKKVDFVQEGDASQWYWRMPDGSHVR